MKKFKTRSVITIVETIFIMIMSFGFLGIEGYCDVVPTRYKNPTCTDKGQTKYTTYHDYGGDWRREEGSPHYVEGQGGEYKIIHGCPSGGHSWVTYHTKWDNVIGGQAIGFQDLGGEGTRCSCPRGRVETGSEVKDDVPPLGHSFGTWVDRDTSPYEHESTLGHYKKCARCGEYYSEGVANTSHHSASMKSYPHRYIKDADHIVDGMYFKCEDCGHKIYAGIVINYHKNFRNEETVHTEIATITSDYTLTDIETLCSDVWGNHNGYTFNGWSLTPNGSVEYSNKKVLTADWLFDRLVNQSKIELDLYADWSAVTYTLNFDTNLGSLSVPTPYMTMTYDNAFILPTCSRTGYTFKGWMIKSGSNIYDNHGTNTDPLINGVTEYFDGTYLSAVSSNYENATNFSYLQDANVELVAIWNHTHATSVINDSFLYTTSPEGYIYETTTPKYYTSNDIGYWVNTNEITELDWHIDATSGNVIDDYYHIKSFGVYKNGDIEVIPVSPDSSTCNGNCKILVTENNYGEVYGYISVSCDWHDAYNTCTSHKNVETVEETHTSIMGDCDAPSIHGLEVWQDLIGLDLSEIPSGSIKSNLYSTDDGSGIRDLSAIRLYNDDNGLFEILSKTNIITYGATSKFTTPEKDLTVNKDSIVEELLNGLVEVQYNLIDNVGNTNANTEDISIFDMSIDLHSHTYNPDNKEYIGGVEYLSCKQGESIDLTIHTTGYANAVRVEFPEEWYQDTDYPIYVYTGNEVYDISKVEPVYADYFYLYVDSDNKGNWTKTVTFVLPLYAEKETLNTIKCIAYKGDLDYIDAYEIVINKDATVELESLTRSTRLYVNNESIIDDILTKIKDTYRKRRGH